MPRTTQGCSGDSPRAPDRPLSATLSLTSTAASLEFLHESFTACIEERRAAPRGDALTHLAAAKYPD